MKVFLRVIFLNLKQHNVESNTNISMSALMNTNNKCDKPATFIYRCIDIFFCTSLNILIPICVTIVLDPLISKLS